MSAEEWGQRPQDWAQLAEPSNRPLYAEVLEALHLGAGSRLLDLACGSGYAARMAAAHGAQVTGIDLTSELLEIAVQRLPKGQFVRGGIDALPFSDASFDAVTAFNALQFADDPAVAAREAHRVLGPGGRLAVAGFAEPERNESTALHLALEPLRAARPGRHAPYALSSAAGLIEVICEAGFATPELGEVALEWSHPDVDSAVRAVLASGGGAMAIAGGGEAAAREALERAVVPFTDARGAVRMRNTFRYALARRG
jgi:SAM-dependent methyltransferase